MAAHTDNFIIINAPLNQVWEMANDVENWPKDVIGGHDMQLERAVQEALRLLKEKPVNRLTKEPAPPTWGKRP